MKMKIYIIKTIMHEAPSKGFYMDIYDAPLNFTKQDQEGLKEYAKNRGIESPFIIVEVPDDMTKDKFMERFNKGRA